MRGEGMKSRERLIEFVNTNKKPAYKVRAGDIAITEVSGHCGAMAAHCVVFLDAEHLITIQRFVEEYERACYEDESICQHCLIPETLAWSRFKVDVVTEDDLKAEDLTELYKDFYTI